MPSADFTVTSMGNLMPGEARNGVPTSSGSLYTDPQIHRLTNAEEPPPLKRLKLELEGTASGASSEAGAPSVVRQAKLTSEAKSTITKFSTKKSGNSTVGGTSLIQLFTPEMIQEHIAGLRQWVGKNNANAKQDQRMEHQISRSACHLCSVEKLTFEPPIIFCTVCTLPIKKNALYYSAGLAKAGDSICITCYKCTRAKTVEMDKISYLKAGLEKRRNDQVIEEPWVQCHKCNQKIHQICALFNFVSNEDGEAGYTCPECCMSEIERGEWKPLQASAVLGAKDLPRTLLSDHLEKRLARRVKIERTERARALGKSIDEVPGAEGLVIRVVSCVGKKVEVNQHFREILGRNDYPIEFPYKSKAILLFQKIEGVDVCLFGMYVAEFGKECQPPNQGRVYLSYMDSVKYFRPAVKAITGEALRTYVYHEILIAYLDYCKRQGMNSCYIWAYPPSEGEDYIFYSQPEVQITTTQKSRKLHEWYTTLLEKATRVGTVVEVTNLYDHFFVSTNEAKAKITAARLPYFDGDYWPSVAEGLIVQLEQEMERNFQVIVKEKNAPARPRARHSCSSFAAPAKMTTTSKDLQFMDKLGQLISPYKENCIMVHMHYACTHCRLFITSGFRWGCKQCKNFQLCDTCYDAESKREGRDQHPITSKEAHGLTPIRVEVPQETQDQDKLIESEFFDNRKDFLSLCEGNHYQYDTLRRARHSSMMVLYHLHNPTVPAFVAICNLCSCEMLRGQGWRCKTCPDFDLCNSCQDLSKHPHKLTPQLCGSKPIVQNKEVRKHGVFRVPMPKILDLVVDCSKCRVPQCNYPNCQKLRRLYRHVKACGTQAQGGCAHCKIMWYLLQVHARACEESECQVPRCKDLKDRFGIL